MNQQGNPKTRRALVIAITLNGVLAVALLYVWWRSHHAAAPQPATQDSLQIAAESGANSNSSQGEATLSSEPSVAPVQLTPQRLQSIGVKFGTAELKQV
jgi:predicted anti-sigma-YlaC factor YlaD